MTTADARLPWDHDAYCPGIGQDEDHVGLCRDQAGYPSDSNDAGYDRAVRLAVEHHRAYFGSLSRPGGRDIVEALTALVRRPA